MKKILVIAGGSGPKNILKGLHHTVGDNVKVQVLVNALDNGLSTGQCRQVYGGKLLGPSDVRKNAVTRHIQRHGDTALAKFMNHRFTVSTDLASFHVNDCIDDLENRLGIGMHSQSKVIETLRAGADAWFKQPLTKSIEYHDFSISNLIYAGIAGLNGNSLYTASKIIARDVLDIEEDFVILNSDESVFINAVTKKGTHLTDEVDIDEWDNAGDPIVELYFTSPDSKSVPPPALHPDAVSAIKDADLVVFSSGTQWTSLIPTYMSGGFYEAISKKSPEQLLLIMNNVSDTDMTGLTASDVQKVLSKYLPMDKITTMVNSGASDDMQLASDDFPHIILDLSGGEVEGSREHHPKSIGDGILKFMYADALSLVDKDTTLVFDYDDTLVGRNNSFAEVSNSNLEHLDALLKGGTDITVCSGNSIRGIRTISRAMTVYADNGINQYFTCTSQDSEHNDSLRYRHVCCIDERNAFKPKEITEISELLSSELDIDASKIINKGNAGIGIKPVIPEYRTALVYAINTLLKQKYDASSFVGGYVEAKVVGRTSIDICSKRVNKMTLVDKLIEHKKVFFIGDEGDCGNDACVKDAAIKPEYADRLHFLSVEDPSDTYVFLKLLATTV